MRSVIRAPADITGGLEFPAVLMTRWTARPSRARESLTDDYAGEPTCNVCGTVTHPADGGYQCRYCGHLEDIPWIDRPAAGDHFPGIHGG